MNRMDRFQAILTTIQSKKVVTAEFLAKKYDVSIRTIYRDIRSLEEAGIPIGAEAGVGYFMMDGYFLPPVMFTKEEGRALILAGKIVEKMSDHHTANTFEGALTKIRSVLDNKKKDELENLGNKIKVLPQNGFHGFSENNLILIKEALVNCKQLHFDYTTSGSMQANARCVDPLGLLYYNLSWHLIAFCHLRNDYRDFRTDRIKNLRSDKDFISEKYKTLTDYFNGLFCQNNLIRVEIKVDIETYKHIVNSRYQMGFLNEIREADGIKLEFAAYSLEHMSNWILMLGEGVNIISPEALKLKTVEQLKVLNKKYIN